MYLAHQHFGACKVKSHKNRLCKSDGVCNKCQTLIWLQRWKSIDEERVWVAAEILYLLSFAWQTTTLACEYRTCTIIQVLGTHKHTNLEGKILKVFLFFLVKHKHRSNCGCQLGNTLSKSLIFRRQKPDVSNWATMKGKLHKSHSWQACPWDLYLFPILLS